MKDAYTKEPLQVYNEGTVGPYVQLPYTQLPELQKLLDAHKVYYWVEELVVSLDDEPEIATVNFGRKGDPEALQSILDAG